MENHFNKLISVVKSVYAPSKPYTTPLLFQQQLSRFIVYVEFNMSMPDIPPEEALDLYVKEMAAKRSQNKRMVAEEFTQAQSDTLFSGFKKYDERFKECEAKYLNAGAGKHVPTILKDIIKLAKHDCFMVRIWRSNSLLAEWHRGSWLHAVFADASSLECAGHSGGDVGSSPRLPCHGATTPGGVIFPLFVAAFELDRRGNGRRWREG